LVSNALGATAIIPGSSETSCSESLILISNVFITKSPIASNAFTIKTVSFSALGIPQTRKDPSASLNSVSSQEGFVSTSTLLI
jgi:hypothetical protein